MRVRFLTPTELKSGQQLARPPEFSILAARIRDRVSTLRELYCDGPLEIDFRAFGERAALVRMTRCHIGQVEIVRRSSRTGQVHTIGGFTGEARVRRGFDGVRSLSRYRQMDWRRQANGLGQGGNLVSVSVSFGFPKRIDFETPKPELPNELSLALSRVTKRTQEVA